MNRRFDAIVVGLGAMGSAAIYQLAKRGKRVLGVDQFAAPHHYGSSHGESRIIRQAIGEGEQYVPLALRSYELFRDIERQTGQELLTVTGGLTLETPQSETSMHGRKHFLAQAIRCAQRFDIKHEILEPRDIKKRYPQFATTDEHGYFEYQTGYLKPERCIDAQLRLALDFGATIRLNEKVVAIEARGNSEVTIATEQAVYVAESIVVSAGPWITDFLPRTYRQFYKIYRQVMFWFEIRTNAGSSFAPGKFPIFIWIFESGKSFGFYGFPSLDGKTIKIASEQYDQTTEPDRVDRTVSETEKLAAYTDYVSGRLPGLSDRCETALACLYTATPDANFVIDFHPETHRIILASPCSGHGFKHSAAVGEVLADLAIDGASKLDISSFGCTRFTP